MLLEVPEIFLTWALNGSIVFYISLYNEALIIIRLLDRKGGPAKASILKQEKKKKKLKKQKQVKQITEGKY